MNTELDKVNGIVQFVGTKFNGSVKVNDTFYNFRKGVKNPAKVGDNVSLTLESWESNGKNGVNIVKVEVHKTSSAKVSEEESKKTERAPSKASEISNGMSKEEWANKDKRISRQGCIQVAVQVTTSFEKAVELADKMLGYVNG